MQPRRLVIVTVKGNRFHTITPSAKRGIGGWWPHDYVDAKWFGLNSAFYKSKLSGLIRKAKAKRTTVQYPSFSLNRPSLTLVKQPSLLLLRHSSGIKTTSHQVKLLLTFQDGYLFVLISRHSNKLRLGKWMRHNLAVDFWSTYSDNVKSWFVLM